MKFDVLAAMLPQAMPQPLLLWEILMREKSLSIWSIIVCAIYLQLSNCESLRAEDPAEHAKSLSQAFRQAAREVQPAVVTIISHFKPSDVDPLRQFRQQPRGGRQGPEFPREGEPDENGLPTNVGSGVIFNDGGLVLTNAHVVRGAEKIVVRTADGNEYPAADVRADSASDIAVLKIESSTKFPVAKLGDSTKLDVGDWVIAIGSPFELEATVSAGIISAKGRTIGHIERGRLLQTDATINPGNSGGPLVNLNGEVIGINTAIATNTGVFTGVGFAVPVNLAKWVSSELLEHNKVRRAWLGVQIGDITPEAAREFQVPIRGGVWLYGIIDGAPAAQAGLQRNDIIVEFGGVPVRSQGELLEAVEQQPIGSNQNVVALRKGERKTFSVKVEAYPEAELLRRRTVIPTDDEISPDIEENDSASKDKAKKDNKTKKDNAKKESGDQ